MSALKPRALSRERTAYRPEGAPYARFRPVGTEPRFPRPRGFGPTGETLVSQTRATGQGCRGGAEIKTAGSAVSASSNSALTTEILGPIRHGRSFRSARRLTNGWLETALFTAMAVNASIS